MGLISIGDLPTSFDDRRPPPVPDYNDQANWAALPWRPDAAHVVPACSGAVDRQATALVDAFFVHPTSYFGRCWNAPASGRLTNLVTCSMIAGQASAFNGVARVYAPRYRQMSLGAFNYPCNRDKALSLAYSDVKRAFEYYIERFSEDRPFLLAGHSQGSRHLLRLIDELFAEGKFRDRLIAAYVPGARVWDGPFKRGQATLPVCRGADDTGCILSWRTFAEHGDPSLDIHEGEPADGQTISVNPISGLHDEEPVPAEENLGSISLLYVRRPATPVPALVGAHCRDGILWIQRPKDFRFRFAAADGNYHAYDYHLFYMNIRADAERRVAAFLGQHPA